ncbi:MAG: SDR family oxidoreductase [Chloroflexales bacterium]|nr:SDR family oxidoreductase [Chloroflexales bacterium]
MKDFEDKVVAITGGATGIGFSFAKQFGKEGAKIVIAARREERLQAAVQTLTEMGIEAKYFICDVTKRDSVEAFADFAWNAFGKVDVIVNNAGAMLQGIPVIDLTVEQFQHVYNVNIFGIVNGSAVFGKRFIQQGTPTAIYNVGSENSLFNGTPMGAAYVSSKHAVLAITESLKQEVPDFIEVGLICPGFVRSELNDAELMQLGMDADQYTSIAMEQIKAGEFYIVSHAYNIVRINERHDAIAKAFEQYAPRYEGDNEFDVWTLYTRLMETSGSE